MIEAALANLITGNPATHPWLGIDAEPFPGADSVLVEAVAPQSPASTAGLRPGDLIDAVSSDSISASRPLWTLIQRHQAGDVVDLAVTRNGERRLISVELSAIGD